MHPYHVDFIQPPTVQYMAVWELLLLLLLLPPLLVAGLFTFDLWVKCTGWIYCSKFDANILALVKGENSFLLAVISGLLYFFSVRQPEETNNTTTV